MRNLFACSFLFFVACTASVPYSQPRPSGASNEPTGTPVKGAECTGDKEKECVTGEACNKGKKLCVPTCQSDLDCSEDGEVCGDDSYCTAGGASCDDASACEDDEVCKDNSCQKPGRCTTKEDCPLNYSCFQNACLANTTGSCRSDVDCNKSAQCQNGGCKCVNNKCQVNAGAKCTPQDAHTVCASTQFCDSGVCVAAKPCAAQTDCLGALICLDGYCKTPKACNNGQCDAGYVCTQDFCLSDQTGKECTGDAQCASGFYCNIGIALPGQTPKGVCAAGCKNDADCPTAGQKCDLTVHQCLTPGTTATRCDFDTDCDPACSNADNSSRTSPFAFSDKVCDVTLAQQGAGGKQGICRDRCIKTTISGELVPCPGGKTCVTSSLTGNTTDRAVYCGTGFTGGYSACY